MKTKGSTLQVVSVPRSIKKGKLNNRSNGEVLLSKDSRVFEDRFEPRYKKIPALPKDLPATVFSQSSNRILQERYLLKGGNLQAIETIEERFWHIAYDIASGDFDFSPDDTSASKQVLELAKSFYEMMVSQKFLPNSPTIMNAGKQNGLQYSACFVLPVGDSLPEIFDSIKYAALIHQTGGGTGFAFSRLRQNGSVVRTTGGVASGPVSFLRVFNAATESVKQGGTRRGANMGILRVDHPDILEFIRCKSELDENNKPVYEEIAKFLPDDSSRTHFKRLLLDHQISNFNISVAVTDEFMQAYYKGEDYNLTFPRKGEIVGKLNAKAVFDEIIERAWDCADPGLVFIDRMNHSPANPVPELETIEATNPCGEQPLAPWDACNLGSINLGKFVRPAGGADDGLDVDWEALREVIREAVHFLDNVVQTNPYTLPQIYEEVHRNRRIGLGVMGWADMLFKIKIPYDSEQAVELGEKIMRFVSEEGHKMSEELAEVRGPFPNFPHSIYKNSKPLRNSTVTTIAPTGTISIIGDCSSGIEPVFALAYIHRAKGDGGATGNEMRYLTIANKTFTNIAKEKGFWSDDLAKSVLDRGSVSGVDSVPEEWQKVFITAGEIEPRWHVKMQAAFQKYTDNGVSKTINLPNSATRDDVKEAYLMAWEEGCSGITIYRDGSKTTQVLNVSSTLKPLGDQIQDEKAAAARPMILRGRTYKMNTPVGKAYITVNRDERDAPFELFVTIGKAGMHTSADAEALGRLASLALRISKVDSKEVAKEIVEHLRGIGGASQVGFGKDRIMSLADAIAKALAEDLALTEGLQSQGSAEPIPLNLAMSAGEGESQFMGTHVDLCPECGQASFVFEEGCKKCYSCGYSMC